MENNTKDHGLFISTPAAMDVFETQGQVKY